jgi:hypothetical protein
MKDLIVSKNLIESKILIIRDEKVMLDKDLAELYGVPTKVLNQAVKRNKRRFPNDFMFQLTKGELINLKSQIVTSSWGGTRTMPYAFTEQGVAMLSSVLNSKRAIKTNIAIMRVFVFMRKFAFSYEVLEKRLATLEKKNWKHDEDIRDILETIKYLIKGNLNIERKEIKGFEG